MPLTQKIVCQPKGGKAKGCWSDNSHTTRSGEAGVPFRRCELAVMDVSKPLGQSWTTSEEWIVNNLFLKPAFTSAKSHCRDFCGRRVMI